MITKQSVIGVVCLVLGFGLMLTDNATAQVPARLYPDSVVVSCTSTAATLASLITTAAATMKPASQCAGSYKVANPSTTVNACLGGSAVDTTITAGGRCYPIGNVSSSAEPTVTVTGSANDVYFRCASTIVLYVACGQYK